MGYNTNLFGTQFIDQESDSLGTHGVLRYNPEGAAGLWEPSHLQAGHQLNTPGPLFRKLDPVIIEEERARLGKPNS